MPTYQDLDPDYSQPLTVDADALIRQSRKMWQKRRLSGLAMLLTGLALALPGGVWLIPACFLTFVGGRRFVSTLY